MWLVGILSGCNPTQEMVHEQCLPVTGTLIIKDTSAGYFPPEVLLTPWDSLAQDKGEATRFVNAWYSKHLYSMNEPVLYTKTGIQECYRFTYLPTWHKPVCIRMIKNKETTYLHFKQTDGAGGYDAGELIVDTIIEMTDHQYETFRSLLSKCEFWSLKSQTDDLGCDGAEWILEAVEGRCYHMVNRWSPNDKRHPNFKACCDYLVSLSPVVIETPY